MNEMNFSRQYSKEKVLKGGVQLVSKKEKALKIAEMMRKENERYGFPTVKKEDKKKNNTSK